MDRKYLTGLAFLAVSVAAGLASAQPGGDTYVSGLLHQPLGGAVLGPVMDRCVAVSNIGSSGNDGVSIVGNTRNGLGSQVELAAVLNTPGAECHIVYSGMDGQSKGRLDMTGMGAGRCTMTCDYTALAASGVAWVVRDKIGTILAEGTVSGPTCTMTVLDPVLASCGSDPFCSMKGDCSADRLAPGPGQTKSIQMRFPNEVVLFGLSTTPIEHAQSISFTRIVCITAPCPGDWTNISTMNVTASGVSEFNTDQPIVITFSLGVAPPGASADTSGSARVSGTGDAHLIELCTSPVGCDAASAKICCTNIGSSGNDGVEFSLGKATPKLYLSCRNGPSTPGAADSGMTVEYRIRRHTGHVTILKLAIVPSPATGAPMHFADATGRGSSQCLVQCVSGTGQVLASAVVSPTQGVELSSCSGGDISYVGTCDADGYGTVENCNPASPCILSDGTIVFGVARLIFSPINPTTPGGLIGECVVRSKGVENTDTEVLFTAPPVKSASGIWAQIVGGSTLNELSSSRLLVSNIGSSGQDGVEMLYFAKGGGIVVALDDLLPPSSDSRAIVIRPKGWDGTIKGRITLSRAPGGPITEEYDLTGTGVTGMSWRLLGLDGSVLATGASSGPILAWTLTPENAATSTMNKTFVITPNAAARDAEQGFFDVAMIVGGLTTTPVGGVYGMELTPDPCAGLPENCPPWPDISSMMVTASGLEHLIVSDASLAFQFQQGVSRGVSISGLGACTIGAVESPPADRGVHCNNIGSSGQDGVSIDLGHDADSYAASYSKGCCNGHVTILKSHDTGGEEEFSITESFDPLTGGPTFAPDFSGRGSIQFEYTLFCLLYTSDAADE